MSAASSLLRRRSLRVLTSVLKHRQREFEYLTATSVGNSNAIRSFATGERLAPSLFPRALVQDRNFLGTSYGAQRSFATSADSPRGASGSNETDSALGTGTKVVAVAVTAAALAMAVAYLAFDMRPEEVISKYFPQFSNESQGTSTGKKFQPPESHAINHLSDGKKSNEPPTAAKAELTETNFKGLKEPDSVPEEVKEKSLMTKVIEEFEREPRGNEDLGVQSKDVEDVESSAQISVENDGSNVLPQSPEGISSADIGGNNTTSIKIEVKEEVGQSYPHDTESEVRDEIARAISPAFWIDPASEVKEEVSQSLTHDPVTKVNEEVVQSLPSAFTIDLITEVKEEEGQPRGTATEGNLGSEGPSGQPDSTVDTDGHRLLETKLEDLEPDTFRKEMQETGKEDDLKELSDKILYNQTRGDKDEEQPVGSVHSGDDLPRIVTDTIEAVTDLAEAIQDAAVEALKPEAADVQGMPSIAEAYHLDIDSKKGEECTADEYGSDDFFKYAGAIEEATKRQSEADAQFREMLLKLDEEYQQELREARKKQEEQAEYAKKLKKNLSKEKARWEEEAKQQLHAAEERLQNELKRKEEDAKRELQKMELLTKATTNAAVTAEKARQLEDTKELQIQVEALHRAYNARTEGARVSHTTHKLAMGAFAFEEAMTRGAPLEDEVELLKQAAGGNDELIDVALQSLPEDVLRKGTKTQLQLQREFESLRSPLRQLALIPAGQGGLLTHAMATAVAAIKVREGTGREGVESVIATVEECLANGDLSRAAYTLEQGVKGSRAEPFVSDWTRHVRARVIAEQALALIQAHAIATAAGLA